MIKSVNVADLFCGCGGLSLGFELFSGDLNYKTVIALDNNTAPIKCFNANALVKENQFPTGRLCDISWFNHPSEVLLYYLAHYALWKGDNVLLTGLRTINFNEFISNIHSIDFNYTESITGLINSTLYHNEIEKVDAKIFNLAICKAFLGKIGISSLKNGGFNPTAAPWREEYAYYGESTHNSDELNSIDVFDSIKISVEAEWEKEVDKLEESSHKEGKGQHSVVAERLKTLVAFLKGDAGNLLKSAWVDWRSRRDSLRAGFCTFVEKSLHEFYQEERKINLLLGGPPCKGFSRIGRAVIESLRNQGVHAWACKEYGDERNALLHKYVLFLEALRPEVFIFENVSNFKSVLKTPAGTLDASQVLAKSIEELSNGELHYQVKAEIVKASEYGVPQDRLRYIMVGFDSERIEKTACEDFFKFSKYREFVPLLTALQGLETPAEFDFEGLDKCKTSDLSKAYTLIDPSLPSAHIDYINWIRQPKPGSNTPPAYTDAHIVRKPRADDLALIEKFAPGQRWMDYKIKKSRTLEELKQTLKSLLDFLKIHGEIFPISSKDLQGLLNRTNEGLFLRLILENISSLDIFNNVEHHLLTSGYLDKGDGNHGDWFERLSANYPSKTIVAHIGKDTYGYIHPYENRAISIREAARIQSFPDFFSFGSVGVVDGYTIIGNAVPPFLSNLFARQLAYIHRKIGVFSQPKKTNCSIVNTVTNEPLPAQASLSF